MTLSEKLTEKPSTRGQLELTGETYVDAGRRGKDTWPRYLLGTLLILFFWLVIGSLVTIVLTFAFGGSLADLEELSSLSRFQGYLVLNAGFLVFVVGIVLAVVLIHRRGLRTLVTPRSSISKKRIALGFGVWFVLMSVSSLLSFLLSPSSFWLVLDPVAFIPFVLVALFLTPIQTTAEELFFRGYLVQGVGLISKSPLFLIPVSSVLFMLPHLLNPELAAGFVPVALFYLGVGAFSIWISLKDGTTELAIGVHAANNLFVALMVSFPGSSLDTPSVFYTDWVNPWLDLVSFLAMSALFYVLVFVILKRRNAPSE